MILKRSGVVKVLPNEFLVPFKEKISLSEAKNTQKTKQQRRM
jgi:hypothetical protein